MFEQTCFRELYFTCQIEQLLIKHDKPVANRPIGNLICRLKYMIELIFGLGFFQYILPSDTCPKIKKYCGLFETFSDRRLGDHVIVGLEMLLPTLVKNINRDQLISLFPATRAEGGVLGETWVSVLTEEFENKLNLMKHPRVIQETGEGLSSVPESVPEEFKSLWEHNSAIVNRHLPLR